MIKKYTLFTILFIFSSSCAFKPLYKQTNNFHPNKIQIIIKSQENYENSLSMMKVLLNQKLNKRKHINLKLINILKKNQFPSRFKKKKSTYIIKNNFVRNTAEKNVKLILKRINK